MKAVLKECSYTVSEAALPGKLQEMTGSGWTMTSLVMINRTKHLAYGAPPLYRAMFNKLEVTKRRPKKTGLQRRMSMIRDAVRRVSPTAQP